MKSESDKHVVCGGSCSECVQCLRLYLCNADVWEGINALKTWLDSRIALSDSSSVTDDHVFCRIYTCATCSAALAVCVYLQDLGK